MPQLKVGEQMPDFSFCTPFEKDRTLRGRLRVRPRLRCSFCGIMAVPFASTIFINLRFIMMRLRLQADRCWLCFSLIRSVWLVR